MRKIISNTSDTLTIDNGGPFGSAVISGNSYKILPYLQGAQSYGTKDSGTATGGTTLTVIDTAKTWTTNEWTDLYVLMETGSNVGEISQIASNTSNTLTVSTAFTNAVSSGDTYRIVSSQSFTKRYSDTGLTIGQTYSYRVRGYKNSTCAWPFEYSNIDEYSGINSSYLLILIILELINMPRQNYVSGSNPRGGTLESSPLLGRTFMF